MSSETLLNSQFYPRCFRRQAFRRSTPLGCAPALFSSRGHRGGRIFRREAHAAMRCRLAEILHFVAAMNGVAVLHEKNGMRHGSVIPSLLYQISFIDVAVYMPDGVE